MMSIEEYIQDKSTNFKKMNEVIANLLKLIDNKLCEHN